MIYAVFSVIAYTPVFLSAFLKLRYNYIFGIIFFLFMLTLAMLRYHSGYDYASYEKAYFLIPPLDGITLFQLTLLPFEWGFILLNAVAKSVGLASYIFISIVSILSMGAKFHYFYKVTSEVSLALCIYFSFWFFNSEFVQMRWALALGALSLSLCFLIDHKPKLTLLLGICACSFHILSFIPLMIVVVIGLPRRVWSKKACALFMLVSIVIGVTIDLPALLSSVAVFFDQGYFVDKVVRYTGSSDYFPSFSVVFRYLAIAAIIMFLYSPKFAQLGKVNPVLLRIYAASFAAAFIFFSFPMMFSRLLLFVDLVSVPLLVNLIAGRILQRQLIYIRLFIVSCAYIFFVMDMRRRLELGSIWEYQTWLSMIV